MNIHEPKGLMFAFAVRVRKHQLPRRHVRARQGASPLSKAARRLRVSERLGDSFSEVLAILDRVGLLCVGSRGLSGIQPRNLFHIGFVQICPPLLDFSPPFSAASSLRGQGGKLRGQPHSTSCASTAQRKPVGKEWKYQCSGYSCTYSCLQEGT